MITLYIALLAGGVVFFVLSYIALFMLARRMRTRYPQQWKIIAEPEQGRSNALRTWVRLQHAVRSPALPALEDKKLNGWRTVWRCSPPLGWLCFLGALAMRFLLR
ncbi:hypothetical protein [Rhodanobacter sp. L36]|uniref:hypothetical protein n=1 Tax=Rhodanobacter sp. L36 TaxID=1747221 RepID=UPI00131AE8D8|nr:hypothetical protein [Rhodanobacter sp. L36]